MESMDNGILVCTWPGRDFHCSLPPLLCATWYDRKFLCSLPPLLCATWPGRDFHCSLPPLLCAVCIFLTLSPLFVLWDSHPFTPPWSSSSVRSGSSLSMAGLGSLSFSSCRVRGLHAARPRLTQFGPFLTACVLRSSYLRKSSS